MHGGQADASRFTNKKFPYPLIIMISAKPWSKVELITDPWPAGLRSPLRAASSTNLHLLRSGPLRCRWLEQWHDIPAASVLWIPAGQSCAWQCPQQAVQRCTLHLRAGAWAALHPADAEALRFIQQLHALVMDRGPRLPCTSATVQHLDQELDRLTSIAAQPKHPLHRSGLKAGAITILTLLANDQVLRPMLSSARPAHDHRAVERVAPALHHLERNDFISQPDLSVSDLARLCGYRPAHFHALFVAATGCSPQRYLAQRRIAYACDLLRNSQRSILDIAFTCGFNAQSRFYQAFVRIVGSPPGRWRRAQQTP